MIRTAHDYATARHTLGLTVRELAAALRLSGDNGYRSIQRIEDGEKPVPGPQAIALEAFLSGFRPSDWPASHGGCPVCGGNRTHLVDDDTARCDGCGREFDAALLEDQ